MGGYGSGGGNDTGRPLNCQTTPLSASMVAKAGGLKAGALLSWSWKWRTGQRSSITSHGCGQRKGVTLAYTHYPRGGEPQQVRIEVAVVWTPCHFGGERVWWLCPRCGRRSLKLYGWGARHSCRVCQRIAYSSQREKAEDRIQSRANKLRMRLGGEPGVEMMPPKPKGMHWRTFERHYAELLAADEAFYRWAGLRFPGMGL